MFWTTGLVLVALTVGQVLAGLVKPAVPGVFVEDTITASSAGIRIVSGWEAYPGQFPYIVSLRFVNSDGSVLDGAGSVVHRNWVLTTGFNTFNRVSAVVRAGITDLTATPEYISETTEWWVHPAYDYKIPNNISIMKLQLLLTYSKLLQPIRIQSTADAFRDYEGEVLVASGWGNLEHNGNTPEVLNWVLLRALSNQECSQIYGGPAFNDQSICTRGYNDTTQSTCFGDNGGPLVQLGRDGEPVLVGMSAFWFSPCNSGPTAFMRPGSVHGWLTEVTSLDFENLNEKDEVTEETGPPTTEASELDNEDNDENSNVSDSLEANAGPPSGSASELVNKLKVKVKVTVNNIVNDKKI